MSVEVKTNADGAVDVCFAARAVNDLRKPSAKDYAIFIPVDLSCKCGSKRPAYVDNDDGPVRYSGPKMPPTCLDCGGTRK